MIPQITQVAAAVQFAPELLNVEKNLAIGLQLSFEAAAKGASLIVLPELCTSGFVLRSMNEALQCAQEKNGYQTEMFSSIANRFGCRIVFGYVELAEGLLYNSAAVVGPNGLEGNCRKHNLHGPDHVWATASESLCPIINTPNGRLGVLICRDIMNKYRESYRFEHGQRFYKKGSVDTVALLTSWGESYAYPDTSWVELSEELDANVVVSNRVGKERDMSFKGGSCVIDRTRHIWTNGSSFTENAVVGGVLVVG